MSIDRYGIDLKLSSTVFYYDGYFWSITITSYNYNHQKYKLNIHGIWFKTESINFEFDIRMSIQV